MDETLAPAIDAIVTAALERQRLPGLSLAVARAGETLLVRGYGLRNVGEALPAGADTIYSIASISKQFTVAALMQQVEAGRLRLDDRIDRYFPWHPYGDTIEVRHLLTHTSGIPDYFPLESVDRIGYVSATPREIAEAVLDRPPAFPPGAEYQYCNTGYVLLGALLEAVSGEPYDAYLQRHVLEPLGLTRTGVDDTPAIRSDVAVGYTSFALGDWEIARDYHPAWEFATGGLYSTVRDMLAWNAALRGGRVVSAAAFAQMTTRFTLTTGHAINYGFGLAVSDVGGRREVRHTGGLPGMSTDNTTYPDDDIDIVAFVNLDGVSVYATIVRPILALLLGDPALNAPRVPDLAASSSLRERPQTRGWIRAAAAGALDDVPLAPKFVRSLDARKRAQLRSLNERGEIRGMTLVDASRRDPETYFTYRVDFAGGPLVASLAIRDDDTLAALNFTRWDDRA